MKADGIVLRSSDLVLRPPAPADVPLQRRFFEDPELARLDSSTPEAYAQIDAEAFLLRSADEEAGTLRLAIEIDSTYVGCCSLMNLDDPQGVVELGITIGDRRCWNRGIGREVLRLLLAHAFESLGAREVELTTNAKNPRAFSCFAAVGFRERQRIAGVLVDDGQPVDLIEMALRREDWGNAPS